MTRVFRYILILALCAAGCAHRDIPVKNNNPRVRISAWYWLNSAPKADWKGDFVTMKNLGFTDVLLCWGLDLGGVATRKAETREAMQMACQAGIGVYLIVWQPHANALKRDPKYMQIDAKGAVLTGFDVFNPEWRSTQWKEYLQDIAKTYGGEPALAGYAFDDSIGGAKVSYGPYEQQQFGGPLPKSAKEPGWDRWTKLRNGWWEDWAMETVRYIRAIDPNPKHEIYLEDNISGVTNLTQQANTGVDFGRVAKHFDAVGGYTEPKWTSETNSDAKAIELTQDSIKSVRNMIGGDKSIIYTFWTANHIEEREPGPAKHPTAAEIEQVCDAALKMGVKHLDMYGYRIGEYQVTRETMAKMMPPEPAPYILTGQFPQKFMWDRPEIHDDLGVYLRGLNQ